MLAWCHKKARMISDYFVTHFGQMILDVIANMLESFQKLIQGFQCYTYYIYPIFKWLEKVLFNKI